MNLQTPSSTLYLLDDRPPRRLDAALGRLEEKFGNNSAYKALSTTRVEPKQTWHSSGSSALFGSAIAIWETITFIRGCARCIATRGTRRFFGS